MKKRILLLSLSFLSSALMVGCTDNLSQIFQQSQASTNQNEEDTSVKTQVIGNSFKADFGAPYIFKLNFESETSMSFVQIDEDGNKVVDGTHGSVDITRVKIRPDVYMVYWSEPFNKDTTVTHVQDFEKGWVWTNITTPGLPFINMNGPLTLISN